MSGAVEIARPKVDSQNLHQLQSNDLKARKKCLKQILCFPSVSTARQTLFYTILNRICQKETRWCSIAQCSHRISKDPAQMIKTASAPRQELFIKLQLDAFESIRKHPSLRQHCLNGGSLHHSVVPWHHEGTELEPLLQRSIHVAASSRWCLHQFLADPKSSRVAARARKATVTKNPYMRRTFGTDWGEASWNECASRATVKTRPALQV